MHNISELDLKNSENSHEKVIDEFFDNTVTYLQ